MATQSPTPTIIGVAVQRIVQFNAGQLYILLHRMFPDAEKGKGQFNIFGDVLDGQLAFGDELVVASSYNFVTLKSYFRIFLCIEKVV